MFRVLIMNVLRNLFVGFAFLFVSSISFFIINSLSAERIDQFGSISIPVEGGTPDSPNFKIISPSLQGKITFRGQIKEIQGNQVIFHKVPDLLDPSNNDKAPFVDGQFIAKKPKLKAHLSTSNPTSLDWIEVLDGGSDFLHPPKLSITLPESGSERGIDYEPAEAKAKLADDGSVESIIITNPGLGYLTAPIVSSEGGVHFLRLVEEDSNYTGRYYKITSNTNDTLILENEFNENLQAIFFNDSLVEVFAAWTLGDFFGYKDVKLQTGSSNPDLIYLQGDSGAIDDYESFYHDGNSWVSDGDTTINADDQIIPPGRAIILSRKSNADLDLIVEGNALTIDSVIDLPAAGENILISNPYAVDMMLSDLIDSESIVTNSSNRSLWLSQLEQESADNVQILKDNIWTTYWQDGSNIEVAEKAWATAKPGSGVGASLTPLDISLDSGSITSISNIINEDIIITSDNHGLSDGFIVKITGARGRKTNEDKDQINEDYDVVSDGQGLVIDSSANGLHKVKVLDEDNFKLIDRLGNSDFIDEGTAKWETGYSGTGYVKDVVILFVGGGGQGGKGIAHVVDGKVASMTITEPGVGYVEAPEILFSLGGWQKLGGGITPFSDVLVPAGAGVRLIRNNSNGIKSRLRLKAPI